jgi:hypothetical protein
MYPIGDPFFDVKYTHWFFYCIVCCVSSMCCAYFEFSLLARIALICSLMRVRKLLPISYMHVNGQLLHFSW